MAVILKGGAVFLHIPKTGGTWVASVLKECGLVEGSLGHMHAGLERLMVPFKPRNGKLLGPFSIWKIARTLKPKPFIFCFVRHPLKWYESWFKYMSQPARNWSDWGDEKDLFRWHPNAVLNGCGADDFNQFVRNVVAKRPGYVSELYASYAQPQVDFVGKQENLRADLVAVLKRLNLNFDEEFVMRHREVNASPEVNRPVQWEPALRERVLSLEQVALLRYGYAPETSA